MTFQALDGSQWLELLSPYLSNIKQSNRPNLDTLKFDNHSLEYFDIIFKQT